jgi:uncharacterized protein
MAADELNRPLGLGPARSFRPKWPVVAAIVAPSLVLAIGGGVLLARGAGWAPESPAAIAIDGAEQTGSVVKPPPAVSGAEPPLVDVASGLTEVTPDGSMDPIAGEVVITDPSAPAEIHLAATPREDLIEVDTYGLLPRIGDDGTRPLEAYARPAEVPLGMNKVAIVIGGIGLDTEGSDAAIAGLPGPVTLAIAPYGDDLPRTLAAARDAGHEVLLQLPLEPYNYPTIDPGPKTLTTDASPEENLDRLRWLMSRFTTYVGVTNYMGARFTSEIDAFAPVIAEIGGRGLLYLDDGSSERSRIGELAGKAPVLRADVVLDADTTPQAIDARLDQLAAIARNRGYAIATGSAFPSTIDRIAAFAARAADRGIVIVPVSALVQGGR